MNANGNPTTLDHSVFLDHLPHVRAVAFGVTDGYPRAHYDVIREHTVKPKGEGAASWVAHPLFVGASAKPHAVFQHARYVSPPATETAAELFDRDAAHRQAALEAIAPKVAAAFAQLDAATAASAGLCPAHLWETEMGPAVTQAQRHEAILAENRRRALLDHEARQKAADAWQAARTAAEGAWRTAAEAAALAQAKVEIMSVSLAPETAQLAADAEHAAQVAENARTALQKASTPVPWTTPPELHPLTPEQIQKYHEGWEQIPAVVVRLGVRQQLQARAAAGSP